VGRSDVRGRGMSDAFRPAAAWRKAVGKVKAANKFKEGGNAAKARSKAAEVRVYRPEPIELDVLRQKNLSQKQIDELAGAFALLLAPGENKISAKGLRIVYKQRFGLDFSDEDCAVMVSEFSSMAIGSDAEEGGSSSSAPPQAVEVIDFILFAMKLTEIQNPKDPRTAAGAYGVYFDMASTANKLQGKLQLSETQEMMGSLGVSIVREEAEDMLRYAQGMSLKGGDMGFTGSEHNLPRPMEHHSKKGGAAESDALPPPSGLPTPPHRGLPTPPRGPPPRPPMPPPGPRPPPR